MYFLSSTLNKSQTEVHNLELGLQTWLGSWNDDQWNGVHPQLLRLNQVTSLITRYCLHSRRPKCLINTSSDVHIRYYSNSTGRIPTVHGGVWKRYCCTPAVFTVLAGTLCGPARVAWGALKAQAPPATKARGLWLRDSNLEFTWTIKT